MSVMSQELRKLVKEDFVGIIFEQRAKGCSN